MNTIMRTIASITIAIIVLGIIWYTNRDAFHLGIFGGPQSCRAELAQASDRVVTMFNERAYELLAGDQPEAVITDAEPVDTTPTKPTWRSVRNMLDIDAVVDSAILRLRADIARQQTTDPTSLIGQQQQIIIDKFNTAATWCDKLPNIVSPAKTETESTI